MNHISYKRLSDFADRTPPYRGTKNKYPLFERRYSRYNFTVDEENGQRIFRIHAGDRWDRIGITKEEYESGIYEDAHHSTYSWPEYCRFERKSNEVGIVRPDNTFQITRDKFYQSERMFLDRMVHGCYNSDVRRGGVIYRDDWRNPTIMYPIVRDMKFLCERIPTPVGNYQLFTRRVDRKGAKETLKPYEDFYNISYAMMKSMPYPNFIAHAVDVCKEYGVTLDRWTPKPNEVEALLKEFNNLSKESPLDAAALYCSILEIGQTWYDVHRAGCEGTYNIPNRVTEWLHDYMVTRFNTMIYKTMPGALKRIELEFGKPYPTTVWGHEILLDGKPVEQLRS